MNQFSHRCFEVQFVNLPTFWRFTSNVWKKGRNKSTSLIAFDGLKAGFHLRRSRGRIRKSAYDLVKWETGVGKIRTFQFLPISLTTPSFMIQWKLDSRSRKQKRKNQPMKRPGSSTVIVFFFRFWFRLRQFSFHWIVSDRVTSGICILLPTRFNIH